MKGVSHSKTLAAVFLLLAGLLPTCLRAQEGKQQIARLGTC